MNHNNPGTTQSEAAKIIIKHRYTEAVLFEFQPTDKQQSSGLAMRAALEAATRHGANLRGADLYGADLYGADRRSFDPAIPGWRLVAGDVLEREVSPC